MQYMTKTLMRPIWLFTAILFGLTLLAQAVHAAPVTTHPRLWLRADDLPRLRSWAVDSNPVYRDGLALLAASAKSDMDKGLVPGADAANGGATYVDYPAEQYAELFAFMSLIGADQATRDDYAQRARTLLMYIINAAAKGAAPGQPYRDPDFSINDRSRWHGEGFALTVDWIYPYLSSADKATIRQVFLRWISENLNASINGHDHPEPVGMVNNPALTADPNQVRWSVNNYWAAHMRNIGQMALSFDAADDPDGTLRGYLANATGAWLYTTDYALRHDAQGGLLPEGFEYGPQTAGFTAQFLLSLHTAGVDDTATYGPQVSLPAQPFWNDIVSAYLHSTSPRPATSAELGGTSVYLPAWYGDGLHYYLPDFIEVFAPLGIYYAATGNTASLNALRWIQTNTAPGGAAGLPGRANDQNFFQKGILYFLLFDPVAAAPSDPHANLALTNFSPGLNRILARTDWGQNASWFTYKLSWNQVDHQNGDGNQFEFYRQGEWLTKERSGYDLDYGAPQDHNTLALQNDAPAHNDACAYRNINYLTGAQWAYVSSGNPALAAHSFGPGYVYALGDATNLYNSASEGATDIAHASRSIMWLEPDIIVVFDRATSKTANRFKRFWLNTPALGSVSGSRTSVTTASGQQLFVSTLLPAGAQISAEADTFSTCPSDGSSAVATDEPMSYRIKVEAPGGPADARFLHVLQGADAGASAANTSLIQSSSGTPFAGALAGDSVVLFPVDFGASVNALSYSVPAMIAKHYITGLQPGQGYTVTQTNSGGNILVSLSAGGSSIADSGGVLVLSGASTPVTVASDFNADGKSDLMLRNADGSVSVWLMNGLTPVSMTTLLGPGTGWSATHIGDFDGDGKADILWQHSDGSVALWLMNGATMTSSTVLVGPTTGWSVAKIGDFNGDGKADILWQHTSGAINLWLMNGLTKTAGGNLIPAGSGWSAVKVADFNGDGKADILWQHTNGAVNMWLMNGLTKVTGGNLIPSGTGWSAVQVGDFDGDGKADILWQHTDGSTNMWLMNGLTKLSGGNLIPAGAGWSAVQVADFDGDGKTDILWQHTSGAINMWLMNGLTKTAGGNLISAGAGWSAAKVGDFNGDGKADILWYNTNGSTNMWLMNGLTKVTGGNLIPAGTGWSPAP